jgi:cyclin G2
MKFRGSAQPPSPSSNADNNVNNANNSNLNITSGMRDGSAHVLRCLKVWYDLPSEVFFWAVSSIDRFLTKMKAQPKHLSCIAVSAFHLACRHYKAFQEGGSGKHISVPDPADLVTISQSRCTPSDLLRMQAILVSKLDLQLDDAEEQQQQPVTSLSLLRTMYDMCRTATASMGLRDLLSEPCLPDHLVHQLEILSCDSLTLAHRPCEVALALLTTHFQQQQQQNSSAKKSSQLLMGLVSELQRACGIANASYVRCLGIVVDQLERYNGEGTVAHRQRLVWKLSNRTLRHLRPTDKLRPTLPTIKERAQGTKVNGAACCKTANVHRMRSNSECSEESMTSLFSEDSEDSNEEMMEEEDDNSEGDSDSIGGHE